MRGWILLLLLALLLAGFGPPRPVFAQAEFTDAVVDYAFGETATFSARLHSPAPIQEAVILFRSESDSHTEVQPVAVTPEGEGVFQLSYTHNLSERPLPSFAHVNYKFQVTVQGGQVMTSADFDFFYQDNRFQWQSLEEAPFRVYWTEGDVAFGQSVIDVAQLGLRRAQSLLSGPAPQAMDIYVYPSARQMLATLGQSGQNWAAGHADPNLGLVVVALPLGPDQRLLMEQRIPHELMHLLLFQAVGPSYSNLPTWFNEGLASISELYPNPDYQILLNNAQQRDHLLPIASLCRAFPVDASSALLAYAQSASFTRYLHQRFGTSGLNDLVLSYANGLDCNRAPEAALGLSLNQLERQWQQETFAEKMVLKILNNLLPWIILLVAVLGVPLGLTLFRLRKPPERQLLNS